MPELPDLEVFSRNLNKKLAGKKLVELKVPYSKRLNVTVKQLKEELEGQSLTKVQRVGKELHFEFKSGAVLGLHLMLKGDFHLVDGTQEIKHVIIELLFDNELPLAVTDWQKQATATLNPEERDAPDALSADLDFLKTKLSETRSAIKKVLLDQHVIRGIGNAYADEILWDARISPFSASNKIPDAKIKALLKCIKKVLKDAEKQILKTNPDLITGEVRDFLKIHNAKKKESPNGFPIKTEMINSRKTYFTDEQELFE